MTLIDKAEALAAIEDLFITADNDREEGYDEGVAACLEAIAALPARGVGVKPLVWQRMPEGSAWEWQAWCDLMRGYYYAGTDMQKREHEAVRAARILAALAPTDAATEKGGDAHDRRLRSHEASPGVTAGADAAQAREAALREAHKAILAMDTKKDEDLTYNLAVLRAAEKVRRLIDEARDD